LLTDKKKKRDAAEEKVPLFASRKKMRHWRQGTGSITCGEERKKRTGGKPFDVGTGLDFPRGSEGQKKKKGATTKKRELSLPAAGK